MENLIGKTLGNYRIESVIGTGGMGQVFRAVHIHLAREAAIKVLHANLASEPGFQARFLKEARAIASLKHPNIVAVHDFGEQADSLYLVMELIEGGSLRQLLLAQTTAQAGLPLWTGIDLVRQTADGLALAHAQGMVHRDIKPDNLLLSDTLGGNPVIKITDFGLVRLAESGTMTATGMVLGTAAYMSPEQCQGVELDGRSDLYSLGVVLYEVATGYVPFQAKTLSAAVYHHVQVAPPPPRTVRPDLPLELEQVILRCLAKRPEERYGTAAELSSALRTVLANQATIKPHQMPARQSQPADTVVQPKGRREVQAPPSSLGLDSVLRTASGVPHIRLHDQSGKVLQRVDLTAAGVTIGRAADNNLSYDSTELSRNHLRIQLEGQRVTVTDLGSSNGTYMEGIRLLPQVPQVWEGSQPLRLGASLWVALEPAATLNQTAPLGPLPSRSNQIGVALDSKTMALTPGQPARCKVTLVNLEEIVDHISLAVAGVPEEWVEGTGKEVQLNPGAQATVLLTVLVPQEPASRAGDYQVTISVRSRENPRDPGTVEATWTVLPFAAMSVGISPLKASGRKEASYQVNLRNEGNAPGEFELSGFDEEGELAFLFAADTPSPQAKLALGLEAGAESSTRLKVWRGRRWIGSAQPYRFNVRAAARKIKEPQQATARFIHRALLPTWVAAALPILLLIALGVAGYWFTRPGAVPQPTPIVVPKKPTPQVEASVTPVDPGVPEIVEWEVVPKDITKGSSVVVRWRVKNADSVHIEPLGDFSATGGSHKVEGEQTYKPPEAGTLTFTLLAAIAGNQTPGEKRKVIVREPLSGSYRIIARHSNLDVVVAGASMEDNWYVIQFKYSDDTTKNDEWVFNHLGDGFYKITNAHSGKAMCINGASLDDGAYIVQFTSDDSPLYQWQVIPVEGEGGFFRLENRNSKRVLEVAGAAMTNDVHIQQATWNRSPNQQFKIIRVP